MWLKMWQSPDFKIYTMGGGGRGYCIMVTG